MGVRLLALVLVGCDCGSMPVLPDAGAPDTGSDAAMCSPGEIVCAGNERYVCGADGTSKDDLELCPGGCVDGVCRACFPGARLCDGARSNACTPDGLGTRLARDCDEWGVACTDGYCADECGEAERNLSSEGCEYYSTSLLNHDSVIQPDRFLTFRVAIANPSLEPAHAWITRGGEPVAEVDVPPRSAVAQMLPWVYENFHPPGEITSWALVNSESYVRANASYRIRTDRPVTVSQYNPWDYTGADPMGTPAFEDGHTTDSSLLLPTHALDGPAMVISVAPRYAVGRASPYVGIIGVGAEPVDVKVRTTPDFAGDLDGNWPDTRRGTDIRMRLRPGEVAHLRTGPYPLAPAPRDRERFDPTGTIVEASGPVAVFAGMPCTFIPFDHGACDHLEEQMPPRATLGNDHVVVPLGDPGVVNVLRIRAARADVQLTTEPSVAGLDGVELLSDETLEVEIESPFVLQASDAVIVSQFMTGMEYARFLGMPDPRGDPAQALLVPIEQYRRDYQIVVPDSYAFEEAASFVALVRRPGHPIELDGAAIETPWISLGDYEVATVSLSAGGHRLESTEFFGAVQYGMGYWASYAHASGRRLEPILR